MARKLLSLLAVCAVAAPGAVLASGCGAEDAAGVDVAKAASATSKKGTARLDVQLRMSGMGLPGTLDLKAAGVTALTEPRMALQIDLSKIAATLGVPLQDAGLDLRVDGRDVYVKPPRLEGFELPDGATWAAIDVREVAEAFGLDADGLGKLFTVDPGAQLRALTSAADLEEVGEEEIDGATTTHLRGKYTVETMIASLPAAQRAEAQRAIKQLEGYDEALDDPIPVDLWVDDEGIVRRMQTDMKLPGQRGVPGGQMRMTFELSDFGTKLDVSAPPKDETYDATKAITSFFKSSGSGLLGP